MIVILTRIYRLKLRSLASTVSSRSVLKLKYTSLAYLVKRTSSRSAAITQTIVVLTTTRSVVWNLFLFVKVHLIDNIFLLFSYQTLIIPVLHGELLVLHLLDLLNLLAYKKVLLLEAQSTKIWHGLLQLHPSNLVVIYRLGHSIKLRKVVIINLLVLIIVFNCRVILMLEA